MGIAAAAKVELARGMIAELEAKWPGLRDYLNRTGLGSDLIRASSLKAAQQAG